MVFIGRITIEMIEIQWQAPALIEEHQCRHKEINIKQTKHQVLTIEEVNQ